MHGVWEILNLMLGSQRALRSLHLYYGDESERGEYRTGYALTSLFVFGIKAPVWDFFKNVWIMYINIKVEAL